MNFNKILYIFFFFGFLLFTKSLSVQVASPQNLGSLRVDKLNDNQIRSFYPSGTGFGFNPDAIRTKRLLVMNKVSLN